MLHLFLILQPQPQRYYHPYHRHHLLLNYREMPLPPRLESLAASESQKTKQGQSWPAVMVLDNFGNELKHIFVGILGYFHFQ